MRRNVTIPGPAHVGSHGHGDRRSPLVMMLVEASVLEILGVRERRLTTSALAGDKDS
jgi:hypothetical protein